MAVSTVCRLCPAEITEDDNKSVSLLEISQLQLQWIVENFDITLDDGRICMSCFAIVAYHCDTSRREKNLLAQIMEHLNDGEPSYPENEASRTCEPTTSSAVSIKQSPVLSDNERTRNSTNLKDMSVSNENFNDQEINTLQCKGSQKSSDVMDFKEQTGAGSSLSDPGKEQLPVPGKINVSGDAMRNAHKKITNKKPPETSPQKTKQGGAFVCGICDANFSSDFGRKLHMVRLHKDHAQQFNCSRCDQVFDKKFKLNRHFDSNHNEFLKCALCEYKTRSKYFLKTHIKSIHESYTCNFCNKSYSKKFYLNKHIKRTHPRNLKCDVCHRGFSCSAHLSRHRKNVQCDRRQYRCDQCPETYRVKKQLALHKRVHFVNPVQCPNCDKSFKTKSGLNQHAVTHREVHTVSQASNSFVFKIPANQERINMKIKFVLE